MNNENTIQDELNNLNSGLPSNSNGTPYEVPQGYFEGLAASVLAKVKGEAVVSASEEIAQLSPLLAGISRKGPFAVPDHYFQSNIEALPAFTSDKEESLVLSFIEKEMPYQVPTGYFANFPEQVLERVTERGKVVPLMKRKWMRLAVAAMITGLVAVTGITYFNSKGGSSQSTTASTDPVVVEIKKASTEELNEFVKSTDVNLTQNKAPLTAKNTPVKTNRKELFQDVSDKELESFLDQVPVDDEEIMDLN